MDETAMLREQAEIAGIAEIILNSRVASLVDMDDPYTRRAPITAAIEQMSRIGSRLSGIVYWNQFGKELAVHSFLRKTANARRQRWEDLDPSMQRWLTTLKIGRSMWRRIGDQLDQHGVDKGGLFDPGSHAWTDDLARSDFYAAMRAEADSLVVTPGLGDRPMLAQDVMFRLFFTLKSFWFAAHQRAMLRGLQEDQLRYLTGSAAMAGIGMFVYAYKEWSSGRETSENWGTWIAEGVDRSGSLPLLMEANNMQERVTDLGIYRALQEVASATTGAPRGTMKASRFANRNIGGALAGPAAGFAQSGVKIASDLAHADLTPGTVDAARRLTPFLNTPGVKQLMHWHVLPALKDAVDD